LFTELVHQKFKFLENKGFTLEASYMIKDETSISYISQDISFSFTHCLHSNECWSTLDVIEIERTRMPIPFHKFTSMLEISYSHIKGVDEHLSAIASTIQNELSGLVDGDLSLLLEYRAKSEILDNEHLEYQKKIALTVEKVGNVLIMELPNTKAALGESYSEEDPDYNFQKPTVWLVSTKIGDLCSDNYEQAVKSARMFK